MHESTDDGTQAEARRVAAALAIVGGWMFSPDNRRRIASDAGLTLPLGDYTLLSHLRNRGPIRMSAMAEILGVDKSTLTPPTKRLEKLGLIERSVDPCDSRAQLVQVTAEGRRSLSNLWAARTRAVAELLDGWTAKEISPLADYLSDFAEEIRKRGF
jgi:DNA-binding MarR family transcriptional regulator